MPALKKMATMSSLDPNDVKIVVNRMYGDVNVIDEYLTMHDKIPKELEMVYYRNTYLKYHLNCWAES